MPNVSEKKRKLLYLLQILLEKTDGEHALTLPQLLDELESRGITAERKSIYDDIETLRSVGVKIETRKSRTFQYYIAERRFSLEDLKLLDEAVRSARFIPDRQAAELSGKLETLCSDHQAAELRRRAPGPRREITGEKIVLEFPSIFLESLEKRFGRELFPEPVGKNRMRAVVRTEPDPEFFAWLFYFGTEIRLVAPKKLMEQYRERAKSVAKLYKS